MANATVDMVITSKIAVQEENSGTPYASVLINQKSQSPVSEDPLPPDKANPPSTV